MKSVTRYHVDKINNLELLLKLVAEEFPGVPQSEIKITFGIVSINLEGPIPRTGLAKSKSRRRIFKGDLR
jgi:hypothetical protein